MSNRNLELRILRTLTKRKLKKIRSKNNIIHPISSDSMVPRFSDEIIDALEPHLSELEGNRVAKEMYKSKEVRLRNKGMKNVLSYKII